MPMLPPPPPRTPREAAVRKALLALNLAPLVIFVLTGLALEYL